MAGKYILLTNFTPGVTVMEAQSDVMLFLVLEPITLEETWAKAWWADL